MSSSRISQGCPFDNFEGEHVHQPSISTRISGSSSVRARSASLGVKITKKSVGGKNGGLRAMIRHMTETPSTLGYNVGWGANDRYRRKNGKTVNLSVVAKYLEFGYINNVGVGVPRRPFFRYSNQRFHQEEMIPEIRGFAIYNRHKRTGSMRGKLTLTAPQVNALGKLHAKRVRKTINEEGKKFFGNKPRTIYLKGTGKPPLTDTGALAKKVTHRVIGRI